MDYVDEDDKPQKISVMAKPQAELKVLKSSCRSGAIRDRRCTGGKLETKRVRENCDCTLLMAANSERSSLTCKDGLNYHHAPKQS